MIIDDFKNSMESHEKWYSEEGATQSILIAAEKDLLKISNFVSLCHSVVAEKRCESKTIYALLFFKGNQIQREFEQATNSLTNAVNLQNEVLAFKNKIQHELYHAQNS